MSPSFITILPTSAAILSAIAAILRDRTRPPLYAAGAALVASRDHFYYRWLLLIVAELERYTNYIASTLRLVAIGLSSWLPRDDAVAAFARYILRGELPIDQHAGHPVSQPVDLRHIPSGPVEFAVDTGASINVYNPASNLHLRPVSITGADLSFAVRAFRALHDDNWPEIVD